VYNIGRFLGTFARSITGHFLWSRLRMSHQIVPSRLLIFAILSVLALHIGAICTVLSATRFGFVSGWWPQSQFFVSYRVPIGSSPPPPPSNGLWLYNGTPVSFDDLAPLITWPYVGFTGIPIGTGQIVGVRLSADEILACALAQFGTPFVLLMLPQTRRKHRLREAHILRAVCLGIPFAACVYVVLQLPIIVKTLVLPNVYISGQDTVIALLCACIFLLLQTLWWWSFCRRYLHIPHAMGVAAAGSAIGAMVCILIAIILNAGVLMRLLA
jgi:hypothetical protein